MEKNILKTVLQGSFQTVILVGNVKDILKNIRDYIGEQESLAVENQGDILISTEDTLSIDVVRNIKRWTESMPQHRSRKLLILAPTIFPYISQNALLKTLEEPSGNTQIIIIVKELQVLLPTIISRAVVHTFSHHHKKTNFEFLKLQPSARLKNQEIEVLLKTGAQKPTKEDVVTFFEDLVQVVLQAPYSQIERREAVAVLTAIAPYIRDQSASIKMLIEYITLLLPVLTEKSTDRLF